MCAIVKYLLSQTHIEWALRLYSRRRRWLLNALSPKHSCLLYSPSSFMHVTHINLITINGRPRENSPRWKLKKETHKNIVTNTKNHIEFYNYLNVKFIAVEKCAPYLNWSLAFSLFVDWWKRKWNWVRRMVLNNARFTQNIKKLAQPRMFSVLYVHICDFYFWAARNFYWLALKIAPSTWILIIMYDFPFNYLTISVIVYMVEWNVRRTAYQHFRLECDKRLNLIAVVVPNYQLTVVCSGIKRKLCNPSHWAPYSQMHKH